MTTARPRRDVRWCGVPTVLVALLVSGCISGPGTSKETGDERLLGPGIRNHSTIETDFACPPAAAASCPYVEIPVVDSLCANEIPGYVGCNLTVTWKVTGGGPGIVVWGQAEGPNETQTRQCASMGAGQCSVSDALGATHHFGGPGENATEKFRFRGETRLAERTTSSFEVWLNVSLES
jgi:hypothetical protein